MDMATQTQSNRNQGMQHSQNQQQGDGSQQNAMQPFDDLYGYFQDYARQRPDVVALWCFGIGFVLGWKLKPW